ncbi:MAG: ATP-binding cassette domain-containing protein, partial [Brevundimonas sp.]
DRLTGRENLEVARLLRKAPKNEIDRVLELADLRTAADRLAGGYSQGMRQRLAIARALIGAPDLLILDEPANGLDPDGILELRTFLRGLPEAQGVTVMISSHLLSEIESMADHVGLMHDGRLLVQSPLSDLKSAEQADVEFGVLNPKRALGVFRDLGIKARHDLDGAVYVDLKPEQQRPDPLAALTRKLVNEGVEVFQVATRQPSLESIYLNLVGRRSATSEARVAESADA